MGVMSNPLIKYPVYGVIGCCVLGVPALGVSLARTTTNGYSETAGIVVTVLPGATEAFSKGRAEAGGAPTTPAGPGAGAAAKTRDGAKSAAAGG